MMIMGLTIQENNKKFFLQPIITNAFFSVFLIFTDVSFRTAIQKKRKVTKLALFTYESQSHKKRSTAG